jgi:hypothetical protein
VVIGNDAMPGGRKAAALANAPETAMDLQQKGGCSAIYHAVDETDVSRIPRSPQTMIASAAEIPAFGEAGHSLPVRIDGRLRDRRAAAL